MSLCIATAALAMGLGIDTFTLAWTHSVERTEWRERWHVQGGLLHLEEARVRGSGAGMEPAEGAVLRDGWWVYPGRLAPVAALQLAVSGATGRGWQLCTAGACIDLEAHMAAGGAAPQVIRLSADSRCRPVAP
jgi:hypothetical protein